MNKQQLIALGHPEGIVLEKAVAAVKSMKKGAEAHGRKIEDAKVAVVLSRIKKAPSAYIHNYHSKAFQELAWAWLGTRQEVAT
jgi:hypothetical protein